MIRHPYDRIWLQFFVDAQGDPIDEIRGEVTWADERMNDVDVEYVRVRSQQDKRRDRSIGVLRGMLRTSTMLDKTERTASRDAISILVSDALSLTEARRLLECIAGVWESPFAEKPALVEEVRAFLSVAEGKDQGGDDDEA